MIEITTEDRVQTLRLNRPEAKNAFNNAMYDAASEALIAAATDPAVAVVVLTGSADSFSAGQDLLEMAMMAQGQMKERPKHGFPGFVDQLIDFPKPLICAVNGLGLGIGTTVLGFADLAFMASNARLKCPFTSLAVAPEAASSYTFPLLMGRQNASWMLLSSEWISAEQCKEMGLVFQVVEPHDLMDITMAHAKVLAAKPISSLVESKKVITAPVREQIYAARKREDEAFKVLMGSPANIEAMTAFAEKRPANFADID